VLLEAQKDGGFVAWVGKRSAMFFPPDFASAGVDVDAVLVVFVEDAKSAWRVVDILLRSSGFAAIVLDLGGHDALPIAAQTRFAGLAKEHQIALLELTRNDRHQTSRGSLASLRVEATKERGEKTFCIQIRALKDKRSSPGWTQTESSHGPDGMC
jgi:recombination protein RecA